MCTGMELLPLLGAAASAAGGLITMKEQNANVQRAADARNKTMNATLLKNDSLAQDSRDKYNQRQQTATNDAVEADRATQTDARTEDMTTAIDNAPKDAIEGVSISGSAPTVVKSELAKRMSDALGKSKDQAKALGKLGGYGDSWLNQGMANADTGLDLGQNANFASGNMSIMPYQQDIAEVRSQKPISPLGGLLQGFGSMAGSFGGGGMAKKPVTNDNWAGLRKTTSGGWF